VFDLSIYKLLVLAVIALVVFGPNELPKVASQAGRWIRDLRRIAESAKTDLREGLGPEFQNFEFEDLNPKAFVRKHLMDDFEAAMSAPAAAASPGQNPGPGGVATAASTQTTLAPGESPPYDVEAT
jgi:sec-independent protein translocase protein TatB